MCACVGFCACVCAYVGEGEICEGEVGEGRWVRMICEGYMGEGEICEGEMVRGSV